MVKGSSKEGIAGIQMPRGNFVPSKVVGFAFESAGVEPFLNLGNFDPESPSVLDFALLNISEPSMPIVSDWSKTAKESFKLSSATASSSEASFNSYKQHCSEISESIIQSVVRDEYIEGEVSRTQVLLEQLWIKHELAFREGFQLAWVQLYGESPVQFARLVSISSDLSYEMLEDKADAMVLAAFGHKEPLINEAAMRAVESWQQKKHLAHLRAVRNFGIPWLDSFKQAVIQELCALP